MLRENKTIKNQNWTIYLAIGFELATSVAAGLFIGSYFDEKFNYKTPYFTLIGLILGVIAGFAFLVKLLKIKEKNDK